MKLHAYLVPFSGSILHGLFRLHPRFVQTVKKYDSAGMLFMTRPGYGGTHSERIDDCLPRGQDI